MKEKSVLMSIRPQYVAKILNGNKTIEVRKKFPKDYVGWVYIYCTKGELSIMEYINRGVHSIIADNKFDKNFKYYLNGKIVARFWCDKVEEIMQAKLENGVGYDYIYDTDTLLAQDFVKKCCLSNWDLLNYFGYSYPNGEVVGYAIHVSKLEVFEKPKELTEFRHYNKPNCDNCPFQYSIECEYHKETECDDIPLTKAPQSWCYIEG